MHAGTMTDEIRRYESADGIQGTHRRRHPLGVGGAEGPAELAVASAVNSKMLKAVLLHRVPCQTPSENVSVNSVLQEQLKLVDPTKVVPNVVFGSLDRQRCKGC